MPDFASLATTAFLQATSKALRTSTNAQKVRLRPAEGFFCGSPSKACLSFLHLRGNGRQQPLQQESLKDLETAAQQAAVLVVCEFLHVVKFARTFDGAVECCCGELKTTPFDWIFTPA